MEAAVQSSEEFRTLADALRKRLRSLDDVAGTGTEEVDAHNPSLPKELLEQLDQLVELAQSIQASDSQDWSAEDEALCISGEARDLTEALSATLEASLARWQAQLTTAFTNVAAGELAEQIDSMRRFEQELQQRQQRLDEQREQLENELSDTLQLKARLTRQRRSAGQALRAQRAELFLDIEMRREQLHSELLQSAAGEVDARYQTEIDQWKSAAESAKSESERLQQDLDQLQESLESTRDSNCELETERDRLHEEVTRNQQQSEQLQQRQSELEEQLRTAQRELNAANSELEVLREGAEDEVDQSVQVAELRTQLSELQSEREALLERAEQTTTLQQELEENRGLLKELEDERRSQDDGITAARARQQELEQQLEQVRQELQAREDDIQDSQGDGRGQEDSEYIEQLQRTLEESQHEVEDLKNQNSDLAAQVAKRQVEDSSLGGTTNFNQESLSWEERKQLFIRQLEDESSDDQPSEQQQAKRLEIDEILTATQKEIENRDREIESLQQIIEQQSDARDGVAVGAAAVANMIESDELVQQERERLKQIQQEWEEKLRQAEIDLSMERAKLSRERTQLEAERENLRSQAHPPQTISTSGGEARTRRWLDHLGLKDENKKKE